MGDAQRDSYSNLILLCPTHHAIIDDIPTGPAEYPAEKLLQIKRGHEAWVASHDETFDPSQQIEAEKWGGLIDDLSTRMGWDDWLIEMSGVFAGEGSRMAEQTRSRLGDTSEWMFSRIWPKGHDYLRESIRSMGWVLNDFLYTFDEHSEDWGKGILRTERFYKIERWDPPLYDRLLVEYKEHISIVEDLGLELTRYGNLIADIVRDEIDAAYRFDEGALLVRMGPDMRFNYLTYRPEFTPDDLASGQPYKDPDQFREVRIQRTPNRGYRKRDPQTPSQED